ncbi:NYN domain-containing protein [Sphingomonas sp. A2-49]|uniref:NYN domain-containing protein n=1 Tax=Sphingomonas sp. A2-49 TaxID=1391375 RepID=UPI0021CE8B4F|nr:NYN domain-containing protein [Sphingomonas sp. A2-49]MCU6452675.1 NYN domain-containing protein [Sphingomonas sp. A2-49]
MADETSRNIALLIDADNASWHAIDPVLTVLAELGTVNIRRVYGNWSKPALKGWRDMTVKHGIEPQQQFDLTKGKNATDMKMTIDAMDLLFRGRVDGFGIMSSDSDFMPLAMRIRQDGIPVYGFGNAKTPEAFKQACTRFIDVGALVSEAKADAAPLAAAPATANTTATKPAASKPTSIDVPIGDSLPPALSGTTKVKKPIDPELIALLIDAYQSVKRDEKGYVSLSAMGQLAGNRSSFDARNYGYQRLSDLIQAVPNFQSETRADGRMFVKRVR